MISKFKHLATARPGWLTVLFMVYFFTQSLGLQAGMHTDEFSNLHPDSVMRQDPRMSQMMFEPGEVIVRFRDEVKIGISKQYGILQTGIPAIDAILEDQQVDNAQQLIRGAAPLMEKQMLTAPNGRQFERPSLHNIFLLRTGKSDGSLFELIEALKAEPSVLYAEPNYVYSLVGHSVDSPILTADDLKVYRDSQTKQSKSTITPNDPFFDQQWWIESVNAHLAWEQSTGDTTQVIAIIDTGVDWTHPDLQNKIWTNPNEVENGQDSDGNGFVDDIRGWDFINNNNNPMDDNSHGTHVAGIAAAEADNGIGIAGVSWGARIMPVKVLQSSGAGTAANVVQGVNYASENGATVINMSLGSYSYSMALEDALANAYANAVLVAAAGNDRTDIGPPCCPFFPAALSFVLGVEATNSWGNRTPFSNVDLDGPTYSAWPDLWNYELQAPGLALWSTIPGGSYRSYSGTSMAAPIVAGAVSIYNSIYPNHSQELMWVNLIHTSSDHMDINAALEGLDGSRLGIVSHMLVDTLYGGDADGSPDAGETIQLWYTFRNTGIQANDVYVGIRLGEFEDPDVVEIIDSLSYVGSMSPYVTHTNEQNPLKISIADDIAHNREIVFEAYAYNENETDTIIQPLILKIMNGENLYGVLEDTLVLTADKHWIITTSFAIDQNGVMILEPGTNLEIRKEMINYGKIIAHGTPDSIIHITAPVFGEGIGGHNSYIGFLDFKHVRMDFNGNITSNSGSFESCFISFPGIPSSGLRSYISAERMSFTNCIFYNFSRHIGIGGGVSFTNCNFENFNLSVFQINFIMYNAIFKHNNFNRITYYLEQPNFLSHGSFMLPEYINHSNNFLDSDRSIFFVAPKQEPGYLVGSFGASQYWGTSDSEKIENQIYDFFDQSNLISVNFSPFLTQPTDSAHACVWKVLVNGKDAQDEFVEPVGVGPQRFDVYFNRAMDTLVTPNVTFGVRHPYNQNAVADSGYWSEDQLIYTAWKTIQLYTGDGINRIRVADAIGEDGWTIPLEDSRFEFLIDAAGAASTNFMATPGMGRVDLSWDDPDELDDFLGYNMYRFEHVTDTTFADPILITPQLILEPEHTDFDVLPGDKYYYYYKILRTNMAETDSSRVVMGIPHTADPGDANGDYKVDVMDIVTIVAYMLNQNPQPFIFEAADVNQDGVINVVDIVGVVNLIMNHKSEFFPNPAMHPDPAYVNFKDDIMQIESDGQLTAIEFTLLTAFPDQVQLTSLLPGFELAWRKTKNGIHGFIFNMQNKTIPEGLVNIINIKHQNPDLHWGEIFGADPEGQIVEILTEPVGISEQQYLPDELQLEIFPNPAREVLNIEYSLPMAADVEVVFLDILGRQVGSMSFPTQQPGLNTHAISTHSQNLPKGIVFCRVIARGHHGGLLQKTKKVVIW